MACRRSALEVQLFSCARKSLTSDHYRKCHNQNDLSHSSPYLLCTRTATRSRSIDHGGSDFSGDSAVKMHAESYLQGTTKLPLEAAWGGSHNHNAGRFAGSCCCGPDACSDIPPQILISRPTCEREGRGQTMQTLKAACSLIL